MEPKLKVFTAAYGYFHHSCWDNRAFVVVAESEADALSMVVKKKTGTDIADWAINEVIPDQVKVVRIV